MGYVSTHRTELSWFEILNRQLNNSVLCSRIESQLGNVCCQDEVALLLQAALLIMPGAQGQGGTVHIHGQCLKLPARSQKDCSSLKEGQDNSQAAQMPKAREEEETKKLLKHSLSSPC